jgi:hypothetical protein
MTENAVRQQTAAHVFPAITGVEDAETFPASIAITKEYAISIQADGGNLVVRVGMDGSVEYGPGFTAESAAKRFWAELAIVVADWHKKELL